MKLSPTTVATVVLESNTPTILLDNLAELMGLNPHKLSDSYMVQIIYNELSKELARLQRKQDQLQSLLNNAGPDADPNAKALVSEELGYVRFQECKVANVNNKWMERFPRCISTPKLTLAQAMRELAN